MALFSKPITVHNTCYEIGHCWSPYCVQASVDVSKIVFQEAFKLYGSLYLLAAILRKKGKSYYLKKLLPETLQSSFFLTVNGTLFLSFFCLWRKLAGCYYYYNAFICGIPACAVSLLIERKDRRGLLAVYLTNLALETAYRMAKFRGLIKPVVHGEVLLFSIASAVYFYLFRRESSLPQSTISGLQYIVGSAECPQSATSPGRSSNNNEEPERSRSRTGLALLDKMVARLEASPRHRMCQHRGGCVLYVLKGCYRLFGMGYLIQAGVKLLSSLTRLHKQPRLLFDALFNKDNFRLGAFLGSFSGLFRLVNCVLRWVRNRDSSFHGLLSGFVAGWSMLWYKSSTIALYTATKMAEMLYFKGIDAGYLPYIKCADVLIYSVSTAVAFHAAVLEPHTLRPAYWKFLIRVTHEKFRHMNRRLLDVFGVQSSLMFPDDWPNYDPRFTNITPPS
ncbi:transmembrane protein 135-like isoform X2 [Haliotis rufescens]|uniref:transmembrane protein 135-like isoform X2 n=1 Tax=Haliotis rufescens TaxID=6454 RepID=UPI00201EAB5F|nr:transmembrane protein 135-like isoform X2 [Haliotis rufescens]